MGIKIPGEGGKRKTVPNAALSPPALFCMNMGSSVSLFNVSSILGGQSDNLTVSINHIWREESQSRSNQAPSAYQHGTLLHTPDLLMKS